MAMKNFQTSGLHPAALLMYNSAIFKKIDDQKKKTQIGNQEGFANFWINKYTTRLRTNEGSQISMMEIWGYTEALRVVNNK